MKILIVFGTTEGQTEKIARYMAARFAKSDVPVLLLNAAETEPGLPIDCFDAVIVAGSLHRGMLPAGSVGLCSQTP